MPSQDFLVCTHLGSKETVNAYCGQASSHEGPGLDTFLSPSLLGTLPRLSKTPALLCHPQHHPLGANKPD